MKTHCHHLFRGENVTSSPSFTSEGGLHRRTAIAYWHQCQRNQLFCQQTCRSCRAVAADLWEEWSAPTWTWARSPPPSPLPCWSPTTSVGLQSSASAQRRPGCCLALAKQAPLAEFILVPKKFMTFGSPPTDRKQETKLPQAMFCTQTPNFVAVQTESVDSSIGGIVTDWLTDWLTDPPFVFWHWRATLKTCDLWDIWSEW